MEEDSKKSDDEVKVHVLIRNDLGMTKGKIAA